MIGFFLVPRGTLDHPALSAGREPFCRRAAFCWLVEHAAWADLQLDVHGRTVTVRRGQLCYSVRDLARAWSWSPAKAHRFIERLKTDTLVDATADVGRLLITICNYNLFQPSGRAGGTHGGTAPDTGERHGRHGAGTQKKEPKNTRTRTRIKQ